MNDNFSRWRLSDDKYRIVLITKKKYLWLLFYCDGDRVSDFFEIYINFFCIDSNLVITH